MGTTTRRLSVFIGYIDGRTSLRPSQTAVVCRKLDMESFVFRRKGLGIGGVADTITAYNRGPPSRKLLDGG